MASNPRIDDLRKRLEKDPGSRLFAQLAEELRKDGELEDAIRVSREGLQKHAAYPSARMTLGRALLDTGDLLSARAEFETVLKGAPDNILASRFLGECLEGLGDFAAARDRYRATLALAPGDKQVTSRLQDVEAKLKKAPAAATASVASAATVLLRPPTEEAPVSPIPLSRVDEPMELETSHETPTLAARPEPMPPPAPTVVLAPPPPPVAAPPEPKGEAGSEPPPIPLVAAEEDFELERPYEAPTVVMPPPPTMPDAAPTNAPPAASGGGADAPAAAEFEFDLGEGGTGGPVPEPWRPEPEPPVAPTIVSVSPATLPPMPPPRPEPEFVPEPVAPPPPPPPPVYEAEPPIPPPPRPVEAAPAPPRIEPPPPPPVVAAPPPVAAAPAPVVAAPPVFTPLAPVALPPPVVAPPAPVVAAPPPVIAPPAPVAVPAPPPPADELTSSTLAELYFNQGFTDKAIEVYRQLLQREPGNDRARTRLGELEALERGLKEEESRGIVAAGAAPVDPAASRRQAIERTIARLEGLMAALRKE